MPGWALGQRSTASSRGAGIALLVRGAEFLGREVAHGDVAAVEEERRLGHAAAAWHRLALHAKADLQLRRDFAGDGLQLVKIGAGDVGVAENEADDPGIVEEEILGPLDLGAVRASSLRMLQRAVDMGGEVLHGDRPRIARHGKRLLQRIYVNGNAKPERTRAQNDCLNNGPAEAYARLDRVSSRARAGAGAPQALITLAWPGSGTAAPAAVYSPSLLRSVRIEMPRIFAACVRLPRQWSSVSRMRSCSTCATVRPTRARVTASAVRAARVAGSEAAGPSASPSGVRIASTSISGPVASSTARCIAFSSSRTLPRHELRVMSRFASSVSERCGTPFRSAYFRPKYDASSNTSAGRSRNGGMRRWTTLRR